MDNTQTKIIVVGSLSQDMVLCVNYLPTPGETIIASDFKIGLGGKGNNQAIAASRSGVSTYFIGNIGSDEAGKLLKQSLIANCVHTECLYTDSNYGTGLAFITITPDGNNSIIIAPQANNNLKPELIEKSSYIFSGRYILLLQLETPIETSLTAAKIAFSQKQPIILNPAPAAKQLPKELLEIVDFFIPNQSETQILTGIEVTDFNSAKIAAQKLKSLGPKNIIITMGDIGVYALTDDNQEIIKTAYKVSAIDTVAAGDAFCGAFAAHYSQYNSIEPAIDYASCAGALATTKTGAVDSLPYKSEILDYLEKMAKIK